MTVIDLKNNTITDTETMESRELTDEEKSKYAQQRESLLKSLR